MSNSSFLDILIGILIFFAGMGLVGAFMMFFVIKRKNKNSESSKREISKAPKPVSTDPLKNLTEHQLKELLSNLKEEKEVVLFGFDNMSPTHREAAILKKAKIEEMIEKVENAIGDCYFSFQE